MPSTKTYHYKQLSAGSPIIFDGVRTTKTGLMTRPDFTTKRDCVSTRWL